MTKGFSDAIKKLEMEVNTIKEYVSSKSNNLEVFDKEPITLFVSGLSKDTSEKRLEEEFAKYGTVKSVNVPEDKDTGEPRGFAFVVMLGKEVAKRAIKGLHKKDIDGRKIHVKVSEPKK